MAIENLTTYTEVDPSTDLTVTTAKVAASGLDRNYDAYLYEDFGADHFDEINALFSCRISSLSDIGCSAAMGFANVIDDRSDWTSPYIHAYLTRASSEYRLYFGSTYLVISSDTVYYCHLLRSAGSTTAKLYVYSDSERTTPVGNLTRTDAGTGKFRYFYPITNSNTNATNYKFYGFYENFDLVGAAPPSSGSAFQVRFIGMMM